jgi:hypothetical protein
MMQIHLTKAAQEFPFVKVLEEVDLRPRSTEIDRISNLFNSRTNVSTSKHLLPVRRTFPSPLPVVSLA